MIGSCTLDYSGLAPEELARYAALCRKGDEDSLMRAQLIYPNAVADAATIKRVLGLIAARPDKAAASKRRKQVETELAAVNDQIAALEQKRAALRVAVSDARNVEGAGDGLATRLGFEADNPAVRLACAAELKAVLAG